MARELRRLPPASFPGSKRRQLILPTIALYHFNQTINGATAFADSGIHSYNLTIHDSSGNGTGVVLSDNTTWMNVYPNNGKVVSFAGVGNYVEFTGIDPSLIMANSTAQLAIDLRIYPRSYGGADQLVWLFHLRETADSYDREWSIFHDSGTQNLPQVYGPRGTVLLGLSSWQQLMTPNVWHHLRITIDKTTTVNNVQVNETKVYVDDALQTTSYPQVPNVNGQPWTLHIGDFDGDIDEVVLSSSFTAN